LVQLQLPNHVDRQTQDQHIAHRSKGAVKCSTDLLADAVATNYRLVPEILDWMTDEDIDNPPNDGPEQSVDNVRPGEMLELSNSENSHVEEQDAYFDKGEGRLVGTLECKVCLDSVSKSTTAALQQKMLYEP
jgi:hypothetical protein